MSFYGKYKKKNSSENKFAFGIVVERQNKFQKDESQPPESLLF